MRSPLSVCIFSISDALAQSLFQYLRDTSADGRLGAAEKVGERYTLNLFNSVEEFLKFIQQEAHHVDCLIFQENATLLPLLEELQQRGNFFPAVIVQPEHSDREVTKLETLLPSADAYSDTYSAADFFYHAAALKLPVEQLNQIGFAINQAISKFIQFSPTHSTAESVASLSAASEPSPVAERAFSLKAQQLRLAEKLKERLGYLGVYYKRNPQNFLRHMTQHQREELLHQLKDEYREIILAYFSDEPGLNQKIDNFVNVAFFADVPVSQIVEIHMDLMDEFSKQLKLEGRSDEILQDYRLTLIDTIAHLCEMYRRSIPRES
ncbi:MAG: circadian clock protein KaiA [Elainellaceae cyanobacterium]